MKKVIGSIDIEIQVHCPHCGHGTDVWEQMKERIDLNDELTFKDLDILVECEHCDEEVELTEIKF